MDSLRRVRGHLKIELAKQMRRDPSPLERHAWSLLRNRGILGLKFRRQYVVGGFIVDYLCFSANLIVEVDGAHHSGGEQAEYDRARTTWLKAAGFEVIRVEARDLTRRRLEELLRPWAALCLEGRPVVSPLPKGGDQRGEDWGNHPKTRSSFVSPRRSASAACTCSAGSPATST